MYWELRCCGGKSHILTIQHRISKIAENSLVKLGIWFPYNSSLSHSMQPRQTYSPGFTNGRTDKKSRQAINPSAAMLRSGLKNSQIIEYRRKMQWKQKTQNCFYVKYILSCPCENGPHPVEERVNGALIAPNSLIRSYFQPCTKWMWGMKDSHYTRLLM